MRISLMVIVSMVSRFNSVITFLQGVVENRITDRFSSGSFVLVGDKVNIFGRLKIVPMTIV